MIHKIKLRRDSLNHLIVLQAQPHQSAGSAFGERGLLRWQDRMSQHSVEMPGQGCASCPVRPYEVAGLWKHCFPALVRL